MSLVVANTIAQQIGQRAFFMMGTRYKTGDEKSLSFDIRGSRKFSKIQVTLEFDDTYTVEFFAIRSHRIIRHEIRPGVYAEQLHAVIENETGLSLSL